MSDRKWGIAANKHHKHGRINATEACKKKGWEPGVVLISEAWTVPRRLVRINFVGVMVQVLRKEGCSKIEDLNTFPGDVHIFEDFVPIH